MGNFNSSMKQAEKYEKIIEDELSAHETQRRRQS